MAIRVLGPDFLRIADAEEHAAGGEAAERREGLRDDRAWQRERAATVYWLAARLDPLGSERLLGLAFPLCTTLSGSGSGVN